MKSFVLKDHLQECHQHDLAIVFAIIPLFYVTGIQTVAIFSDRENELVLFLLASDGSVTIIAEFGVNFGHIITMAMGM